MAQILVVDDDARIRKVIREILEIEGYEIREAGNGIEALESYAQRAADLVIMDIVMPQKEGIETIIELRQKYQGMKVIAMSGVGENSPYLLIAQHLGADRILDKPFDSDKLLETVKEILES